MFNSICTFPLPSDLLAQGIHPISPLLALGLASGHVQIVRLPALPPNSSQKSRDQSSSTNGHGTVDTAWRTRRHKGSCRTLAFNLDGSQLFSAGTDGLVKVATTETGEVIGKIAVPSSAIHIYDLRADSTIQGVKPQQTHRPHDDYVSSLTALSPSETSTSGFSRQWFSTGGSTVAVTDVRKGIVFQSEDLGEEVLSGTVIGDKMFAGGEKGALRMWEGGVKGLMGGVDKKFMMQKGESLDVMCKLWEEHTGEELIAVGLGDGAVKIVQVGTKRTNVVDSVKHDEVEGVVTLGLEPGGRMISGGGSIVKIWEKETSDDLDDEEADVDQIQDDSNDGADGVEGAASQDESSEEERRPKRKKRKRNKGKNRGESNHIMAFKGMD
ncbi:MAG: hypothetical protein Q9176_003453 [Flavoplaca citrina]